MEPFNTSLTGNGLIGPAHTSRQPKRDGAGAFPSVNPRTRQRGSLLFDNATPQEVARAAQAASEAFGITRGYSAARLADFLERLAGEIEVSREPLLQAADWETGLGQPRLVAELGRTTGQLRAFGGLLREGSYVEAILDQALPERPSIRRMLVPIGPVAVFGAGNFPFAFGTLGGDTASTFAAGCPVVVKGHPGHPATCELFAQAAGRAVAGLDFPPGFFSLLQGETAAVGQALVTHPLIEAVGFTGSLRGGRAIYDAAAARPRPIPVYAEMGSLNPVVILPGALQARGTQLAGQLVASATLGTGQYCTKPGALFVIESQAARDFIAAVTDLMEQQAAAGVLLNEKIEQGLAQVTEHTLGKPVVARLAGGASTSPPEFAAFAPCTYPNTVLLTSSADFRRDMELQVEHFGPVILFVVCTSFADLLETLQVLEGNLTATIQAEEAEIEQAARLLPILREKAGRLIWNGVPTGVAVVSAMQHGGPYPATTAPATTSVGMQAIRRFLRPVAYQNFPEALLPEALKDDNPLHIWRLVDNERTKTA